MNVYLIDYQNINSEACNRLKTANKRDKIIIFYSNCCKSISIELFEKINTLNLKIEFHKVEATTKNALDFELSTYLGYLIHKNKRNKYYIISNDKGFDCVCDYWKAYGYFVDRISSIEDSFVIVKPEIKENSSSKIDDTLFSNRKKELVTIDEVKAVVPQSANPMEIYKLINSHNDKHELCNSFQKLYNDSSYAGEIYRKVKPLIITKYEN